MLNTTSDDVLRKADFLGLIERDVPALAGRFNGRRSPGMPCPRCHGTDRFNLRYDPEDGIIRAYCNQCAPKGMNAFDYIMLRDSLTLSEAIRWWTNNNDSGPAKSWYVPTPEPITPLDPAIMEVMHADLGNHIAYFRDRGIPDRLIEQHKLGWHRKWNRYAIPCITDGQVWGIQCRIEPRLEKILKAAGKKYSKYLSVKGSHNKTLFNANVCGSRKLPFMFVVEGPMDALMMTGLGYPCVSSFMGNNRSRCWDRAWNKWLLAEVIWIVPDNDAPGSDGEIAGFLFAQDKQDNIPNSLLKGLPDGAKDVGELYKAGGAAAIRQWIGLPPQKEFVHSIQ